MTLRFTPRATRDLEAIGNYIRSKKPGGGGEGAGRDFGDLAGARSTYAGRAQSVAGVRKIVARRYPYIVYYSVDADGQEVNVIAINHPAREREFSDL